MEIAILPKMSLRIKGKNTTFAVDPQDKITYPVSILLSKSAEELQLPKETVSIIGPGEYEFGGVKTTALRSDLSVIYSMNVDGVDILLGKLQTLDKMQHKVKEHTIVVALCNDGESASFLTSLAANTIILYGEKAEEVVKTFGENVKQQAKYQATKDKLPAEVETVLLTTSV